MKVVEANLAVLILNTMIILLLLSPWNSAASRNAPAPTTRFVVDVQVKSGNMVSTVGKSSYGRESKSHTMLHKLRATDQVILKSIIQDNKKKSVFVFPNEICVTISVSN